MNSTLTRNEEITNLRPHGRHGYAWEVCYDQVSAATGVVERVAVTYSTAKNGLGLYFTCKQGVRSRVCHAGQYSLKGMEISLAADQIASDFPECENNLI